MTAAQTLILCSTDFAAAQTWTRRQHTLDVGALHGGALGGVLAFDCLVDEPRSPQITVSLLDAAVITAASSDFCVLFGGRPSCHSRIICLRAAGPAATSVGTIQFF